MTNAATDQITARDALARLGDGACFWFLVMFRLRYRYEGVVGFHRLSAMPGLVAS
jgi:hypothetical protein